MDDIFLGTKDAGLGSCSGLAGKWEDDEASGPRPQTQGEMRVPSLRQSEVCVQEE